MKQYGKDFQLNETGRSVAFHIILAVATIVSVVTLLNYVATENAKTTASNDGTMQEQQTNVDSWVKAIKAAEADVKEVRTEYNSTSNPSTENTIMNKLAARQSYCIQLINSYVQMTKTLPPYVNYETVWLQDCNGK